MVPKPFFALLNSSCFGMDGSWWLRFTLFPPLLAPPVEDVTSVVDLLFKNNDQGKAINWNFRNWGDQPSCVTVQKPQNSRCAKNTYGTHQQLLSYYPSRPHRHLLETLKSAEMGHLLEALKCAEMHRLEVLKSAQMGHFLETLKICGDGCSTHTSRRRE